VGKVSLFSSHEGKEEMRGSLLLLFNSMAALLLLGLTEKVCGAQPCEADPDLEVQFRSES